MQEAFVAEAAILVETQAPLVVDEVVFGPLQPGQVALEMVQSNVCRSQLLEASGGRGMDKFLPHLLGHEGVAKVVATHEDVEKVKPGEKVVVGWLRGSGADSAGPNVLWRGKPINAGPCTTFSSISVVSENRVFLKPPSLTDEHAALLGCAASTGFGMVRGCDLTIEGGAVAIVGLGGIGLFALLTVLATRPDRVLVVESNPRKHAILPAIAEAAADTCDIAWTTDGENVKDSWDVVFEASGSVRGVETAIDLARPGGGHVVVASHPSAGDRVLLDPFDLVRGKSLQGTWGGGLDPEKFRGEITSLIHRFQPVIERVMPPENFRLHDINSAFASLARGDAMRPSIRFSDGPS